MASQIIACWRRANGLKFLPRVYLKPYPVCRQTGILRPSISLHDHMGFVRWSQRCPCAPAGVPMKENAKRIVIIDDEPDVVKLLQQICRAAGYEVESTTSADEFRHLILTEPDFVLLDLLMPDADGVELLRYLADQHIKASIVFISGADARVLQSVTRLAISKGLRVHGTLAKPFGPAELTDLLAKKVVERMPDETAVPELTQPDELLSALREGRLVAYFQPQVDLASGQPISCEALVRWENPRQGLIFPDRFIPVAEQSGIMGELTENIAIQAFRHCSKLIKAGFNLRCAINVSALSLADIHFPDRLLELLSAEEISPSSIVVEVTESRLYDNAVLATDVLSRLRMKGFELSVDDFGTGYSSLRQLQLMPFNELKIDKGFIQNCETNREAESIVRSSIELGQRLGMRTVAEGVETHGLAARLRDWGCNIGQGYFYAKALPSDMFLGWLHEFGLKT